MLEQELRAIEHELKVAKELGIKHITIMSDSALAENIVVGRKEEHCTTKT